MTASNEIKKVHITFSTNSSMKNSYVYYALNHWKTADSDVIHC